jgi:hypothetical protein
MHYFTNADGLTATCEGGRLIATLEARGFQRCTTPRGAPPAPSRIGRRGWS